MKRSHSIPSTVAAVALALTLAACMDPFSYGTRGGGGEVPDDVSYQADVYGILLSFCSACHADAGSAASTGFVLSNDAASDYDMVAGFVTAGDSTGSLLLQKASGATAHGGSGVLADTSIEFQILAAWVEQGAAQQ